jgi:transcriptional regulator with XRE-family HTH domain
MSVMPKKTIPGSKISSAAGRAATAERSTLGSKPSSKPGSKLTPSSKPNRRLSGSALSKKPNRVDQHVAKQLRLRRVLLGMSQEDLAQRLGGSPQQVQKYEAGETRISASRLYEIGLHLGVPITWFFADLDKASGLEVVEPGQMPAPLGKRQPHIADLMASREARDLVAMYFNISDPRLRKKVIEMAGLLTDREKDEREDLTESQSDQLEVRGKLENGAA